MSLDTDERTAAALERIADALEMPRTDRLPELVDIAQRGLDRVAYSFRPDRSPDDSRVAMQDLAMELRDALDAKPCDDRTCTDRDHWAPIARINHGSTPTTCIYGQDHSDALECEYATVMRYTGPTVTVDARSLETGEPVPVSVAVRKVADPLGEWRAGVHVAEGMTVRIIGADGSTRVGTVGEMVEADGLTNWTLIPDDEPDPLDEDDHRPRHNRHGGHVYRHGPNHWHDYGLEDGRCDMEPAGDDPVRLSDFPAPLTFCDCDDAATEAENGATIAADPLDEDDHRPRHLPVGLHLYRHGFQHWHTWNRQCRIATGHSGDSLALSAWSTGCALTFCDCDAATIEAENGATD